MTRPSWDEYFINIAEAVASRASCPRKSVGAVLVRDYDKRIVATGYNGAPASLPHCTDEGCKMVDGHCKRARHAEINTLDYTTALNPRISYTMYTTLGPCDDCLAAIKKWPIRRVVSKESYAHYTGENDSVEYSIIILERGNNG